MPDTVPSVLQARVHVCSITLSCLTLCDPTDYSPPSPKLLCPRILQARILECVSSGDPGDLLNLRIKPTSPASPSKVGRFFTTEPSEKNISDGLYTHFISINLFNCGYNMTSRYFVSPALQIRISRKVK